MNNLIFGLKLIVLLAAIGWAYYASSFFLFLADAFPTSAGNSDGQGGLLASIQAYMVAFGPLIAAAILLMVRWPQSK